MAGPVIKFTEEKRENFSKFVGITQWVCILPSFVCLVLALYIQLVVEDKINFIEDYNGAILPGFLVFSGFFGLFTHLLCGKVAYTNRLPEKRGKWMKFLLPALIATAVIFLAEFISGIMCFVHIQTLEESFHAGIQIAMAAYKDDATAKEEMDLLQMEYGCCGSRSYTDWFTVSWFHPDYMSQLKSQISKSKRLINDDVPFSCCNPQVLRPCIPHHVHDNGLHYNYDYKSGTTLYIEGCTDKLMEFYKNSVLLLAGGLVLVLSCVELVLVVCLRLLQTAVTSSVESDDQEGPSYGYLFQGPQADKPGLDTTIESTEYETLLDTTADTADTADTANTTTSQGGDTIDKVDEFGGERYVEMEPFYENVPPFEIGAGSDEHIYNEGEVEDYLAGKFARSREKFEPISESGYENLAPAFMAPPVPPPPPPIPNVNHNRSPTSLHKVQSNYGSYMAMNISNSSWATNQPMTLEKLPKRPQRKHKVRVKRRPFPSPTYPTSRPRAYPTSSPRAYPTSSHRAYPTSSHRAYPTSSPRDEFVINMDQSKSPTRFRSFTRHRHKDSERRRLLDDSPPNFLNISQNRHTRSNEPWCPLIEPRCLYQHSATNISPRKISPSKRETGISSDMLYSIYGKRRSPQKKSPKRRISPQKTTFKSGVSYNCNHAYE